VVDGIDQKVERCCRVEGSRNKSGKNSCNCLNSVLTLLVVLSHFKYSFVCI
jgi:hypothetical protein